jgi:predicted metal-dependent phosphoesterase TrpH
MIDLHSHTTKSDGSLSPRELVELARRKGLTTLAITDHDTLEGYDEAIPFAREASLDLICGVELSTKFHGQTIHVLGYFFPGAELSQTEPVAQRKAESHIGGVSGTLPAPQFRAHLSCLQTGRKDRNRRLAARLQELGLAVTADEVERIGRSQAGRPHFAKLLVQKGYVKDIREAFDRYLDESAPGYVERSEASLENITSWIHEGGGIASWAHPVRMVKKSGLPAEVLFHEVQAKGIDAIEAYHSDHSPEDRAEYLATAAKLDLAVTGGSDFHGDSKPHIDLGGVTLPAALLTALRRMRSPNSSPGLS